MKNETCEVLFHLFLTTPSDELEALYGDGEAVDVESLRAGFNAGYAAAQKVQQAKIRLACQRIAQRTQ